MRRFCGPCRQLAANETRVWNLRYLWLFHSFHTSTPPDRCLKDPLPPLQMPVELWAVGLRLCEKEREGWKETGKPGSLMSQIYANTYLNWCMRNFCMSGAEPRLKFGERNPLWRKCSKQSAGCITHVNRMLYIVICHGLLARNIETKGLQNFVLSKSEPISDAAICRAENTSGMKSPMLSRSFPQHTFTWHAITDIVQNHLWLVADCLQGSTRSRGALLQQRCHQGWEPLGFLFEVDKVVE